MHGLVSDLSQRSAVLVQLESYPPMLGSAVVRRTSLGRSWSVRSLWMYVRVPADWYAPVLLLELCRPDFNPADRRSFQWSCERWHDRCRQIQLSGFNRNRRLLWNGVWLCG